MTSKKYSKAENTVDVVLFIACKVSQTDMVENTLWTHGAIGVSLLNIDN